MGIGQFLHLSAMIVLAGGLAWPVLAVAARQPAETVPTAARQLAIGYRRIARWACLAALATMPLWLIEAATALGGQSVFAASGAALIPRVLLHSQFGLIWCTRCGLLFAVLATLIPRSSPHPFERRSLTYLSVALGAAALLLLAWTGHAAASAGPFRVIHLAADLIHLAAVSLWLGGLLPFGFSLASVSGISGAPLLSLLQAATRRYGAVALGSVIGLAVSGALKCWLLIGSIGNLATSDYGELILIKLGLILPILALAGYNRWRLTPQLLAIDLDRLTQPHARQTLARFRYSVAGEIGIGVAILIVAGVLASTPPPHH